MLKFSKREKIISVVSFIIGAIMSGLIVNFIHQPIDPEPADTDHPYVPYKKVWQ